jgi:hypothetical protein
MCLQQEPVATQVAHQSDLPNIFATFTVLFPMKGHARTLWSVARSQRLAINMTTVRIGLPGFLRSLWDLPTPLELLLHMAFTFGVAKT